jgi:hypothetical protein
VVARGTRSLAAAGTATVRLKPTAAGKRKLRRLRKARLTLKVVVGGRTFTRTVTLKR